MSARKKTWVKSAFGQLDSSAAALKSKANNSPPKKGLKRSASSTFSEPESSPPTVATKVHVSQNGATALMKANNKKKTNNTTPAAWIESFAPSCTDELAIHAKKLSELQSWLEECGEMQRRRKSPSICLITGPSGAGKTAAIRVLAAANRYQLQEWINPLDQEVITTLGDQWPGGGGSSYVGSQVEAFRSFLLRASRYKSLLDGDYVAGQNKRHLLLVEDFPNSLISDADAFNGILEDYSQRAISPLVFIVADSKSRRLNISYNLFSDQVKSRFHIDHISLNPIANTLMQRAMKRFCTLMRQPEQAAIYKVPPQSVLDSIVICAQGDIRNALINLHFASLKGAPCLLTKPIELSQESGSKTNANKKRQSTLKSVGRDESVTMLHALGRVFNPKFTAEQRFLHTPEDITASFCTEPKKFIDFVYANYLPHFADIEQVVMAANDLSQTDLILNEYREDALAQTGLNVGLRGVMAANRTPVSGWMPVRGPKRWSVDAPQERAKDMQTFGLNQNLSPNLYATDYRTFLKCIRCSR